MRNDERFQRLRSLTAVEAATAWLEGDFGIEDDAAMVEAIRKDRRIKVTDERILNFFTEALARGERNAPHCLDVLAKEN